MNNQSNQSGRPPQGPPSYKVDVPMSRIIGGVFWGLWLWTLTAGVIFGAFWVFGVVLMGVMIGAAS